MRRYRTECLAPMLLDYMGGYTGHEGVTGGVEGVGPVTLCDTRPLAEDSAIVMVKRCRTHHKRIARMRDEWVARGGQNA